MKCPKCKNDLIEYGAGDSKEYICPVCDEMPATQVDDLIEYDSNKYVLKILVSKNYDRALLKKVSQLCSCNVLEAKRIIEETGKEFKPMDALEMRALKRKIDSLGVLYVITPTYKWI